MNHERAAYEAADQEIIRYLLGALPEAEQAAFEVRYFGDDELFARVTQLREELADRYVRRQLSADERARYEQHLLTTPAQHKEIAFAETLRQVLAESAAPQPRRFSFTLPVLVPRWSLAMAAMLLAGLLGGMWWLWRGQQRLLAETTALRAAQTEAADRERRLQDELAALRVTASPKPALTPLPVNESYVALLLKANDEDRGSGDDLTVAVLPANTHRLKLTLPLGFAPEANSVSASLQSTDKKIRLTFARLPTRCQGGACQALLETKIPALKAGDYRVELKAVDESDQQSATVVYRFRLTAPK